MGAQQPLGDERKPHRESRRQARPEQGGRGPLKLLFSLAADRFVNHERANGATLFRLFDFLFAAIEVIFYRFDGHADFPVSSPRASLCYGAAQEVLAATTQRSLMPTISNTPNVQAYTSSLLPSAWITSGCGLRTYQAKPRNRIGRNATVPNQGYHRHAHAAANSTINASWPAR